MSMYKMAARMEMDPYLSTAYGQPVFMHNFDIPDSYDLMSDEEQEEKDELDYRAAKAGLVGAGKWGLGLGLAGAGIGALSGHGAKAGAITGALLGALGGATYESGEVRDKFMRKKLREDPEYYHRIYGTPVGSRKAKKRS